MTYISSFSSTYTAQNNVYDNPPEYAGPLPQAWNAQTTIPNSTSATTYSPATSSVITQDGFKRVTGENACLNHRVTKLDQQLQHLLSQLSTPNATSLQPQSSQTTVSSTTSAPIPPLEQVVTLATQAVLQALSNNKLQKHAPPVPIKSLELPLHQADTANMSFESADSSKNE